MNGLDLLEQRRASLADRLLMRKPKENAAVEINNYVACTPLADVTAHDISRIMAEYKCAHRDVKPALALIYTQVVSHFVQDGKLSVQEQSDLTHLRKVFGLTEEEAGALDREVLLPLYQQAVRGFFADGHFTAAEREQLETIRRGLDRDKAEADTLIMDEAFRAFERGTKRKP
jgi:hypothetical protein